MLTSSRSCPKSDTGSFVARMIIVALVASLLVVSQSRLVSSAPGDRLRPSSNASGVEGNADSYFPEITPDGRYVVFQSSSSNLVTGDTNITSDVFIKDLNTGSIERVSVDSSGTQGNGWSYEPTVSADGRYIAFLSASSNLVAADTNSSDDVFLHDRQTGATERVSVSSSGGQGNFGAWTAAISGNGRFIAFGSSANNLVSGDTNGRSDVFLRDLDADTTTRISVTSSGGQANDYSPFWNVAISYSGDVIAFDSKATNLVSGDTNGKEDVFVHDTTSGDTDRVSVTTGGSQGTADSWMPALSADGNLVAFSTVAVLHDDDGYPGWWDIYLHHRDTATTELITDLPLELRLDSDGGEYYVDAHEPSISPDGRFVAWYQYALSSSDPADILMHDRNDDSFGVISTAVGGGVANGDSFSPALSDKGRFVTFDSEASDLVPGDTNGVFDIFRHEVDRNALLQRPIWELFGHRISSGYAGDPVNTATGNFVHTEVDLDFPDSVAGLEWARTYNSRNTVTGTLGEGWSLGLGASLEATATGTVTYTASDGRRVPFEPDGSGGYERPEEFFGDLTKKADGTFEISRDDGTTQDFDTSERLATQTSWDGQTVTFTYGSSGLSAITSSVGYSLSVSYNVGGRISQVSSSDGRSVTYAYNPSGHLTSATNPSGGMTTYARDASGLITSITDPDGKLVIANSYDADGRVVSQTTPSDDTITFTYDDPEGITYVGRAGSGSVVAYEHDRAGRLIAVTDPHGAVLSKGYDADGNLTSIIDRRGSVVTQTFDAHGNLTSRVGPGSSQVTITYDGSDRVTSFIDELGATTTFSYEGDERIPTNATDTSEARSTYTVVDGLVTSAIDPDGVQVTMTYDSYRSLTSVTDEAGNSTTYTYDAAGNMLTETLPSGRTTTYTYDEARRWLTRIDPAGGKFTQTHTAAGRISATQDEVGAITAFSYDSAGRLSSVNDALANSTSYGYDADGNVTSITRPGGATTTMTYGKLGRLLGETDPTGVTTTYSHDADGNLTATQDSVGETQRFYDSRGRLTKMRDPIGRFTTYTYDAADRLSSIVDPSGAVTEFDYDGFGRLVSTLDARGGLWGRTYTPGGRLSQEKNPLGQVTEYSYNQVGRLSAVEDPEDNTTSYEYDSDGRLTTVTPEEGLETGYSYDPAGRLSEVENPAGGISKRSYSLRGEVTKTVDATGGVQLFSYDLVGRLTKATDANGGETLFSYDGRGNLIERTDALDGVESYTYDKADRLIEQSDPLMRTSFRKYDSAGRLAETIDPSGRSVAYSWDAANQLISRSYLDGSSVSFSYDLAGRRTQMTDWTGTTAFTWDDVGNLTGAAYPSGKSFAYGYDLAGNVTATTYPGGTTVNFTYDGNNRISGLTHPTAGSVTYTFDDDGRLTEELLPDSVSRDYAYTDGWLTGYTEDRAGVAATTTFTRDLAGRILTESSGTQNVAYSYDSAGQLVSASRAGVTTTYGYDAVGNRTQKVRGDVTTDYLYDPAHQLVSATRWQGLITQDHVSVAHDHAGRMISANSLIKSVAMTYDARGRLSKVATVDPLLGNFTTDRTHDADGRLVEAQATWATSTVHDSVFTWDISRDIPQIGMVSNASVDQSFVYGMGREFAVEGSAEEVFSEDAYGSVLETPATADLVLADQYDEFGRPSTGPEASLIDEITGLLDPPNSANHTPQFGYRGELTLDGMTHLRAREYLPGFGRFISKDPLEGIPGEVTVANPYPYGANDPLNQVDPLGERPENDISLGMSMQVGPLPKAKVTRMPFSVPVLKGYGRLRINFFIKASTVEFLDFPVGHGDGRGFDSHAMCNRSRVCLELDFETGRGFATFNYSCQASTGLCFDALPIGSHNRVIKEIGRNFQDVMLDLKATNSAIRGVAADYIPAIDASIYIAAKARGKLSVEFEGDDYPSLEIYHDTLSGTKTIIQDREGPIIKLLPPDNERRRHGLTPG